MAVIQDVELKDKKGKLAYRIIFAILAIGVIFQFMPLFLMITGTFKTPAELVDPIPKIFPSHWSFDAYKSAFEQYQLGVNVFNSFFIAAMVIIVQVTTSAMAAYSLSKLKPKCGEAVYMLMLGTMMFSGTALMFPTYIMMSKIGLIGNKFAVVLSLSAWAYSVILFRGFFDGIPKDLLEAGYIDGANKFQTLIHIMLPLSKPIFAVNILNTFMAVYNEFVLSSMLLPDAKDWTLMIRLYLIQQNSSVPMNVIYVLLVVTVVPIILFYLLAQNYIAEGVTMTGIKG